MLKDEIRLGLLLNDDPTSSLIFSQLLGLKHVKIQYVAYTTTLLQRTGFWGSVIKLFREMPVPVFAFYAYWSGIFKLKEVLGTKTFRNLCKKQQISVYSSADFNSQEFLSLLKRYDVDLVVTRANQILKKEMLSLPRIATLCVHSSLLPSYKGIAAEFHSLKNLEKSIGSTVFEVERELDAGRIVNMAAMDTKRDKTLAWHIRKNNELAGKLLVETINAIQEHGLVYRNSSLPSSYYSWPSKADFKEFRKKHKLMSIGEAISMILNHCWYYHQGRNETVD